MSERVQIGEYEIVLRDKRVNVFVGDALSDISREFLDLESARAYFLKVKAYCRQQEGALN